MKRFFQFFYLYLVTFLISSNVIAQTNTSENIEVEVDPFAYFLNGYSIHLAYNYSNFRFSIGTFGIQQPDFALDNDAFAIFTSGFDFKADYLFKDIKGFFIGAQSTYSRDRIGLKNESDRKNIWGGSVGLRTGYRFMFGKKSNNYKGFYIVPWVVFSYSPDAKTIKMGQEEYQQSTWFPFPTIHMGWKF